MFFVPLMRRTTVVKPSDRLAEGWILLTAKGCLFFVCFFLLLSNDGWFSFRMIGSTLCTPELFLFAFFPGRCPDSDSVSRDKHGRSLYPVDFPSPFFTQERIGSCCRSLRLSKEKRDKLD